MMTMKNNLLASCLTSREHGLVVAQKGAHGHVSKELDKHEDVIMDKLLTNNVVETFNPNWTDTMEHTPILYSVIEGFIRQVC